VGDDIMELLFLWEKIEQEFSDMYGCELCEFLFLDSKLLTFSDQQMVVYLDDLSYALLKGGDSEIAQKFHLIVEKVTSQSVVITKRTNSSQ
jgi:hypothetical protein